MFMQSIFKSIIIIRPTQNSISYHLTAIISMQMA